MVDGYYKWPGVIVPKSVLSSNCRLQWTNLPSFQSMKSFCGTMTFWEFWSPITILHQMCWTCDLCKLYVCSGVPGCMFRELSTAAGTKFPSILQDHWHYMQLTPRLPSSSFYNRENLCRCRWTNFKMLHKLVRMNLDESSLVLKRDKKHDQGKPR